MKSFDFTGKAFLVTGASSGIGRSVAKYLSECGASVVLVARQSPRLSQVFVELAGNAKMFAYDLTNLADIHLIFDFCRQQDMMLSGMVHCAGMCPLMTIKENDISLMSDTFKINCFSFIELVRHFSGERCSFENSSIVAMSSIAAVTGGNRQCIYSASKAALNTAVKSMAPELYLNRKIRINTIMPGAVETEMLQELRRRSERLDEKLLSRQFCGIIEPDNIAGLAVYLLSDMGKYMTGMSIPVNGGHIY